MRPLRLEIEGFTSFRERVCLDFEGLDLFAITGPTGAGKSSLVDAMVFALYGQVPRVGNQYAQLLSHGKERLSVRLDFAVGDEHYRVARTLRTTGTPQTRLEKITGGTLEPLADRVKDAAEQVERLIGLDYDGFVRAVVLPQGQFDAFLRGEPKERRKILVALLRLSAYEKMHEAANRRAAESRREAEFIAGQLAQDFALATPEALERKRGEAARAEDAKTAAAKRLGVLNLAAQAAGEVRRAARDLESATAAGVEEEHRTDAATARHRQAVERLARTDTEMKALEQRQAASSYDENRFVALSSAVPQARRWAELESRRAAAAGTAEARRSSRQAAALARGEAEHAVPRAEDALSRAMAALDSARAEKDRLGERHAAHALRRGLSPGELCPVCTQPVVLVPPAGAEDKAEAVDADAKARIRAAQGAADQAQKQLTAARVEVERLRGDEQRLMAELARFDAEAKDAARGLLEAKAALAAAGLGSALEGGGEPGPAARRLEAELQALAKARTEAASLDARRRQLDAERAGLLTEAAAAEARSGEAERRLAEAEARIAAGRQAVESARAALRKLCDELGLSEWAESPEAPDVEAIEARRAAAQRDLVASTSDAARLCAEAAAIEAGIARAAELRARKDALDARFALAQSLAQHLRADQFMAYVQEEAMRVLAADGTRHLKQLSQGRYSLCCEGQEFFVVDHWNADHRRSVKTLSGGETFLASLGLALALAESFVALSADGGAGEALESLFLDEGFGTLDPETLTQVVRAIEELQGGARLVGIITHIPELADQMPARVEVGRSERGATLAIA
jgi:exonuclease SbcC